MTYMNIASWAVLALLAGSNVVLLQVNRRLTTAFEEYRGRHEIQLGDIVPPLRGLDANGEALEVSYGLADKRPTLIIAFRPGCPYCAENWPLWSKLLDSIDPTATRVVAIETSGTLTPEYVATHGLERIPTFRSLEFRSGQGYKIQYVPTTMLVSPEGRLERIWSGVLNADAMKTIHQALKTSSVSLTR